MGMYSHYLGSAMRERIEVLEHQTIGAISLRDELMLMRDLLGQTLAACNKACEAAEELPTPIQRATVKAQAMDMVVSMLNQVRDMATAAAKIEDAGRSVPIGMLHAVVSQTCDIVGAELESSTYGGQGMMERIVEKLRTNLLTVDQALGTSLTPARLEAEVLAMHATVPEVA